MWTALLLLGGAFAQGPTELHEPIVDLARLDVRANKRARLALVLGSAAPGVALVGSQALSPLLETRFGPETGAASLVTTAGVVGMIAMPIWLDDRAHRSRRLLTQQGLTVKRFSLPLLTGVVAVAAPLILLRGFEAGEDPSPGQVVGSFTVYAVALGFGARQLSLNRRARRDAGWLDPQGSR